MSSSSRVERARGRSACSRCGSRRRPRRSTGIVRAAAATSCRRLLEPAGCETTTTRSTSAAAERAQRPEQDRVAGEAHELLGHLAAEAVAVATREDDGMDLHALQTTSARGGGPAPPVSSIPDMTAKTPARSARTGVPEHRAGLARLAPDPGAAPRPTVGRRVRPDAPAACATRSSGATVPATGWEVEDGETVLRFNVMQGPGQQPLAHGTLAARRPGPAGRSRRVVRLAAGAAARCRVGPGLVRRGPVRHLQRHGLGQRVGRVRDRRRHRSHGAGDRRGVAAARARSRSPGWSARP